MKFESTPPNERERILKKESLAYESFQYWSGRLEKTLRASLAALVIATPMHKDPAPISLEIPPPIEHLLEKFEDLTKPKLSLHLDSLLPVDKTLSPDQGTHPTKQVLLFPQTHRISKFFLKRYDDLEKEEILEKTILSQRTIYNTLKHAVEHQGLTKVCVEGLTDDMKTDDLVEDYRLNLHHYVANYVSPYLPKDKVLREAVDTNNALHADGNFTFDDLETLSTKILPVYERYIEDYKFIIGGAELLATEGKIELCAAEESAANDKAVELLSKLSQTKSTEISEEDHATYRSVVLEDREDIALKLVNNQSEPVVALVYGASHRFGNNLTKLNQQMPEKAMEIVQYRSP